MTFQSTKGEIHWKIHFASSIDAVFNALATDNGREKYWGESARESDGVIEFQILNYPNYKSKILHKKRPSLFSLEYFGTETTFTLTATKDGGTDLSLVAKVDDEELRKEMIPGWVSVLMAMKAAVDFRVDLRNHDPERSWQQGFADN